MKVEIAEVSATLTQENDSCDPHDCGQLMNLYTQDGGGGGHYYVIETKRWAFDTLDELAAQLRPPIEMIDALMPKESE